MNITKSDYQEVAKPAIKVKASDLTGGRLLAYVAKIEGYEVVQAHIEYCRVKHRKGFGVSPYNPVVIDLVEKYKLDLMNSDLLHKPKWVAIRWHDCFSPQRPVSGCGNTPTEAVLRCIVASTYGDEFYGDW